MLVMVRPNVYFISLWLHDEYLAFEQADYHLNNIEYIYHSEAYRLCQVDPGRSRRVMTYESSGGDYLAASKPSQVSFKPLPAIR
ncbi:hypothetical protein L1987_81359 [Smallanthus sonchifolius]|uniref:Uncharacterized protein n=1 Tax=Smallanthus sonchifolius TaxID=185202 RepID=A0ACB8YPH5_9ASTR|nr:hypothetical protein L1987_81359 [Smallanthus sonchifolius]